MKNKIRELTKVKKTKLSKGGQNLTLLGVLSILIAVVTTGVSLAIYHNSGDIYIDRSRPGYLPDEDEIKDETEKEKEFEFSKTGKITLDDLDKYLENLTIDVKAIDAFETPFGSEVLSDEHFGITDANSNP